MTRPKSAIPSFILQCTKVVRTWDGRYEALIADLLSSPEGANNINERVYIEETNACGASVRRERKESASWFDEEDGDEYTVASNVIRRMSHFLRSSESASGGFFGGFKMENADCNRADVVAISRRTKARAAREYNERRVALVELCGKESSVNTDIENNLSGNCVGFGDDCFVSVLVAVGIEDKSCGRAISMKPV